MRCEIIRGSSRGYLDFGWLETYHTFSFGEYFNRNRMNFGALRVINDDFIKPNGIFPTHPHNNMEIITVVLSGTIEHKDSMGNWEKITAGEIQVMSAGSGITHSERNPSLIDDLNLFQIWIMPKVKNIKPVYAQKSFSERLLQKNVLHNLVSPNGSNDSLAINQDAYISLAEFDCDTNILYNLHNSDNGCFLMVIDGEVGFDKDKLAKRDAISIANVSNINFSATKNSRVIIIEVPLLLS